MFKQSGHFQQCCDTIQQKPALILPPARFIIPEFSVFVTYWPVMRNVLHSNVDFERRNNCLFAVFPFMAQQPQLGQGLLIIVASRSHSEARHSAGLLWTSNRPNEETADNTHPSHETDIGAADGIRTHKPSQGAAAEPRFRSNGHWHRYRIYYHFLCLTKSC